jgi:hypothetical protein
MELSAVPPETIRRRSGVLKEFLPLSISGNARVSKTSFGRQRILDVLSRTDCSRIKAQSFGGCCMDINCICHVPLLVWCLCDHDMDVAIVLENQGEFARCCSIPMSFLRSERSS